MRLPMRETIAITILILILTSGFFTVYYYNSLGGELTNIKQVEELSKKRGWHMAKGFENGLETRLLVSPGILGMSKTTKFVFDLNGNVINRVDKTATDGL